MGKIVGLIKFSRFGGVTGLGEGKTLNSGESAAHWYNILLLSAYPKSVTINKITSVES